MSRFLSCCLFSFYSASCSPEIVLMLCTIWEVQMPLNSTHGLINISSAYLRSHTLFLHPDVIPASTCSEAAVVPSQHAPQQGCVQALRRGQSPLHLPYGHFVLGGGAEQRQAARYRAEHLVNAHGDASHQPVLPEHQGAHVLVRHGN